MATRVSSPCSCSAFSPAEASAGRRAPPTHAHPHRSNQALPTLRHGCTALASQTLSSRRAPRRGHCARRRVVAFGDEELAKGIEAGTKVRVTKAVMVYHSPKLGDFNLESQEGTVLDIVQLYKGKKLSANLPYKVEFAIPQEGSKDVKLIAHLAAPEIEAI